MLKNQTSPMIRSTYKIFGKSCTCPFSQSTIDAYKPTCRSTWVYFAPMKTENYESRLRDFGCLINSMAELFLISKYIHPTPNEWLIDVVGFGALAILYELPQNLRCTFKVVDIYSQKLLCERTPQSLGDNLAFQKFIDFRF